MTVATGGAAGAAGGGGGGVLDQGGSGLADVVDTILDKGLVIDAQISVGVIGINLLEINARVVVASIETYLTFAEAVDRLDIVPENQDGLGGLVSGVTEGIGDAVSGVTGAVGQLGDAAQGTVGELGGTARGAVRELGGTARGAVRELGGQARDVIPGEVVGSDTAVPERRRASRERGSAGRGRRRDGAR